VTRLAGPVRQLGFVVPDADAAMRYWAGIVGIGPFLVFRKTAFDDYFYRGQPSEPPVVTIGVAHSGPLQIEIIQQHNDAPSSYLDFKQRGLGEFHHVSPWFRDAASYDAAYAQLLASGLEVVHQGVIQGCRFSYFASGDGGWPQLEISEGLKPGPAEMWQSLETAAARWDGASPIYESLDDIRVAAERTVR
jgi:hypothetical protein